MYTAVIHLDEGLLFFTEKKYRSPVIRLQVKGRRSVKDLLESIGVPHVEAGRILLNGIPSEMEDVLDCDCRLDVSPVLSSFGEKFLLDVHLGKLAANLRMLGFFADYSRFRGDDELEELSSRRNLILLTCDRGLLMRRTVRRGMLVRSREALVQTAEVVYRFRLKGRFLPFSRCIKCGADLLDAGVFEDLPPEAEAFVPQAVRGWVKTYKLCSACGRPYWKGSHFDGMYKKIDRIIELADLIQQTS